MKLKYLPFWGVAWLVLSACAAKGGGEAAGSSGNVAWSLDMLTAQHTRLAGSQISVSGTYQGWRGSCNQGQARKSDWMLHLKDGCIYVSGPLPQGVAAPPDVAGLGMTVTVQGEVRLAADGGLYVMTPAPAIAVTPLKP